MAGSPQTIPNSLPTANPTLQDLLGALKRDVMLSTNCHGVGTIQSVAIGSNGLLTCTATLDYNRTYYERQPSGSYTAVTVEYPQLIDCPVVVLGGGTGALNQPIAQGDRCLVLFNDRDLGNWFAGARSGPVPSTRNHAFADALVVVGFQALGTIDSVRLMFTDQNANCGINTSTHKVRISNTNAGTLYALLANLITAIEGITVSTLVTSTPGTFTSGTPNNSAALGSAKTALQNLLE